MVKQPKIYNKTLWNGWKGMSPKGVIIHNDYGRMSALSYESWLSGRNPELGFAHYYIDRNTIARYVNTNKAAYHAGDGHGNGNSNYIGYEVVQSRGPEFGDITQAQFLENEDMTLRQAAEDLKFYGLTPNRTTVKLHRQFASTSCPHLSQAIHGENLKVQDYFIEKIKYYLSLGDTVQKMIETENKTTTVNKPAAVTKPTVNNKGFNINGEAHIQSKGWIAMKNNVLGTTGQRLRLEAFNLTVSKDGKLLPISGMVHLQSLGDVEVKTNLFGTAGEKRRLEAVKLNIHPDIEYRVHMQYGGWSAWTKNNEWAGTKGKERRIEAIELRVK